MGCDIHAEIEHKAPGDNYWRPVDWPVVECWYCKGTGITQEWPGERKNPNAGKPCPECSVMPSVHGYGLRNWVGAPGKRRERWLDARNYSRFAILADVRNGYGFAGVDTGDGFRPISQPRGLPDPGGIYYDDDDFRFGDHSFSWLTVDEILAYDYTQTTKRRGWVEAEEFARFESEGSPYSWSGMVAGGRTRHISNDEMRALIASGKPTDNHYTQVEWEVTYGECFGLEALASLKALRESLDGELRLVFGFDS